MKQILPVLAVGALASLALYGVLTAVAHPRAEPEDPWADAFTAEGLKAQFVAISTEPSKEVMFGDGRDLMKGPAFEGTVLRRYVIQNVSIQVVVLPKENLLPAFPERPPAPFQLRAGGSDAYMGRWKRHILLVKKQSNWAPFVGELSTPPALIRKIWNAVCIVASRAP